VKNLNELGTYSVTDDSGNIISISTLFKDLGSFIYELYKIKNGKSTANEEEILNEIQTIYAVVDPILIDFGNHRGKTLKKIREDDFGYFIWICRKTSEEMKHSWQLGQNSVLETLGVEKEFDYEIRPAGITVGGAEGRRRQKSIKKLQEGDLIHLIPEPDNPYDDSAVRLETDKGKMIGYVPKEKAIRISMELDAEGKEIIGKVKEVFTFKTERGEFFSCSIGLKYM
jgi:hypothetical protein